MDVKYILGGELKTATADNEDILIIQKSDGNRTTVTVKALKPLTLSSAVETSVINIGKNDLLFFNGYQSWTDSFERTKNEKEKNVYKLPKFMVNLFALDGYGDAKLYDYDKNKLHGYDFFYKKGGEEVFIINLNKNAYLITEVIKSENRLNLIADIKGKTLNTGEEFTVYDYLSCNSFKGGIAAFDGAYPKKPARQIFGYTSWYNYYENIDEEIILRDLDALDGRFNLFQIDDGYENKVGDWLNVNSAKFPNGLKDIVDRIHVKGFKAGIWLAPFVAEEESELFRLSRHLFKKDKDGNPVKCGSNWSGFYSLDFYNEEAREYIKKCLTHYIDLGFDFFKLDFLYGVSLPEYEGKTRAEVATEAYEFLREILKDKLILGCGATLINAAGMFDYMRIGTDVSLQFDGPFYMRILHRERPSTKNTLQNTVYRSFMNERLFGNDPDVFLLRDDNIKLSKKQKLALITLNALFGSVFMTSDNVATYDDEKQKILKEALEIFYNKQDVSFNKNGRVIEIKYSLNQKENFIKYDTKKGVIL